MTEYKALSIEEQMNLQDEVVRLRKELEDRKSTNAGWRAYGSLKKEMVECQAREAKLKGT